MSNIPLNKPKVEYRHPDQLKRAVFEPERRLNEDDKFQQLVDSVQAVGIWSPIQITPENVIMDGHRRHAAATVLKMPEVPVIVNPLGIQLGFSNLNIATKPIVGQQWLEAHVKGLDLVHIRGDEARKIQWLKSHIGDDGLKRLSELGFSPEIQVAIKRLAAYLNWERSEQIASIVWWISEFKMQRPVIDALKKPPTPAKVFVEAIRKRVPLRQFWGIPEATDDDVEDTDE